MGLSLRLLSTQGKQGADITAASLADGQRALEGSHLITDELMRWMSDQPSWLGQVSVLSSPLRDSIACKPYICHGRGRQYKH